MIMENGEHRYYSGETLNGWPYGYGEIENGGSRFKGLGIYYGSGRARLSKLQSD